MLLFITLNRILCECFFILCIFYSNILVCLIVCSVTFSQNVNCVSFFFGSCRWFVVNMGIGVYFALVSKAIAVGDMGIVGMRRTREAPI